MAHSDGVERMEPSIHRWLRRWEEQIRRRDYDDARGLFLADIVGFGTFTDVARTLDELDARQWRQTWPYIEDFRFDCEAAVIMPSADGLLATVAVTWRSLGRNPDRSKFPRGGRATIVLVRNGPEAAWRAAHTHFSLNRGVPQTTSNLPRQPEY